MDAHAKAKEESGFSDMKELAVKLTGKDIEKLRAALDLPDTVFDKECEGIHFIFALKEWSGFDPPRFFRTLNLVRPDLIRLALRMSWLCVLLDERYEINLFHPYNELNLSLLKRQLFRIQPSQSFKLMPDVDSRVSECLSRIGLIAYQGVASRELGNNQNISLQVGNSQLARHYIDRVQKRLVELCVASNAQSFSYPIIEEFTAALWLSGISWWDQCLCVRFMVHADGMFSLFSDTLRCMCGLLANQPFEHLSAFLYKFLLPSPTSIPDLPECVQLRFESCNFFNNTGWDTFTEKFLQLCSQLVLFGFNNCSIPELFHKCKPFLPNPISFYFLSPVTADKWVCFLHCLQFLDNINLIYLDTEYFVPIQLLNVLGSIQGCSVNLIAIKLGWKDHTEILAYTDIFQNIQLPSDTRISLDLTGCSVTELKTIEALFSCSSNRTLLTLSLNCEEVSSDSLRQLVNQLYSCENFRYWFVDIAQLEVLLPALSSATRISGLHLYYIPIEYHEQLFSLLPELTQVRELTWVTQDDGYALLPHITHLSALSYLQIRTYLQLADRDLRDSTLQVLESNGPSIRGLVMYRLMEVGIFYFNRLVNVLQYCTNLVQLELHNTRKIREEASVWCSLVCNLRSLVYLEFFSVPLTDSGMLHLCKGLMFHPVIRGVVIYFSKQSSKSCKPLTNLIPTLSRLKRLKVNGLSTPDPDPIKLLEQTADQYSVQHFLS